MKKKGHRAGIRKDICKFMRQLEKTGERQEDVPSCGALRKQEFNKIIVPA